MSSYLLMANWLEEVAEEVPRLALIPTTDIGAATSFSAEPQQQQEEEEEDDGLCLTDEQIQDYEAADQLCPFNLRPGSTIVNLLVVPQQAAEDGTAAVTIPSNTKAALSLPYDEQEGGIPLLVLSQPCGVSESKQFSSHATSNHINTKLAPEEEEDLGTSNMGLSRNEDFVRSRKSSHVCALLGGASSPSQHSACYMNPDNLDQVSRRAYYSPGNSHDPQHQVCGYTDLGTQYPQGTTLGGVDLFGAGASNSPRHSDGHHHQVTRRCWVDLPERPEGSGRLQRSFTALGLHALGRAGTLAPAPEADGSSNREVVPFATVPAKTQVSSDDHPVSVAPALQEESVENDAVDVESPTVLTFKRVASVSSCCSS